MINDIAFAAAVAMNAGAGADPTGQVRRRDQPRHALRKRER